MRARLRLSTNSRCDLASKAPASASGTSPDGGTGGAEGHGGPHQNHAHQAVRGATGGARPRRLESCGGADRDVRPQPAASSRRCCLINPAAGLLSALAASHGGCVAVQFRNQVQKSPVTLRSKANASTKQVKAQLQMHRLHRAAASAAAAACAPRPRGLCSNPAI